MVAARGVERQSAACNRNRDGLNLDGSVLSVQARMGQPPSSDKREDGLSALHEASSQGMAFEPSGTESGPLFTGGA
ncbi:hypothetical protein D3C80_1546530 [compost metagenome]